jgi:GTPase SAR1 family protein
MADDIKTFIFCGDKQTGKSNLIYKLLDISVNTEIKETIACDFKYGNKTYEDLKQKVNTYELGGGRANSNLL